MSKEEFLKIQTCVLKVNIHCDGCKRKVKKILQKIDGVYKINIESDLGKVTVSGNVDPPTLIKKLGKNGKHAELWGAPKPNQNQLQNLQIDNGKGGNGNNPPKGGQNGQKGGGDSVPSKAVLNNSINPNQLQQQMKSLQDMKFPQLKDEKIPMGPPLGKNNDKGSQNKKNVTFDLPDDEDDQSDGEFDEDYDDDDDDYDDEEMEGYDDEMEELPLNNTLNKTKPMVGNDGKIPNMIGKVENVGGGGGQNGKKGGGGGGGVPAPVSDGKEGKKGGGGGDGNGKNGGGKNGKGGGGEGKLGNNGGGGQNGNFDINGAKKGAGGISDGLQGLANMGGPGVGQLGNMPIGPMGPMSNGGQMGQVAAAVQGLPAGGGGGYFAGVGPDPLHHHQQHQQLAALMMNQQRANGNERFQPMMYARPPPAINYMPPYPYPYPYPPPGEPYAHGFNDENTSSCNVM